MPFKETEIEIRLTGIESTQDRILSHHSDFKLMFERVFEKLDKMKDTSHELEKKIEQGDNAVRNEIYRNVLSGSAAVIVAMVSAAWAWISHKLN